MSQYVYKAVSTSQQKSLRLSFRSFLCPRATLLPQFLCLRIWPHWKLTKKDTQIIGVWIWTWNVVDADTQRWRLVAIRENIVAALGKRSVPIKPQASTGVIRTAPCDEFLRWKLLLQAFWWEVFRSQPNCPCYVGFSSQPERIIGSNNGIVSNNGTGSNNGPPDVQLWNVRCCSCLDHFVIVSHLVAFFSPNVHLIPLASLLYKLSCCSHHHCDR